MGKQAFAAVGLCVALGGCGGGHSRVARAPTRAQFVARADNACAEATSRSELYAGLRVLRPPAGEEDVYARWLKAVQDTLGGEKPPADPGVTLAIAEGKVAGYARRMGAETCAKRTIGTMPQ
jgi:hypothetical protein